MFDLGKRGRFGLTTAVLALLATFGFAPLSAQDPAPDAGEPKTEVTPVLNPDDPITIDFVKKDIHVVMHYVGLRSGLNITVEGDITKELTVIYRVVKPKDAIKSICESNELLFIENGSFIYIKKRLDTQTRQANVTKGGGEGVFNASFETHELVGAIMEVARVTNTAVYIPAMNRDQWDSYKGTPEDLEKMIDKIQTRKISMFMRDGRPGDILTRLAELGDLDIEGDAIKGFNFKYKPMRRVNRENPDGPDPQTDEKLMTETWVIPGAKLTETSAQIKNLLSQSGRIAFDSDNGIIQVTDVESRMKEQVIPYMQKLEALVAERNKTTPNLANDPMMVKAYTTLRDVTNAEFKTGLTSILTPTDGKVVVNEDRNTVVVYDHASKFKDIDLFFAAIDSEPEQVMLQSKMVEVTLDEYIGYGLQIFTEHGAQNLNNGRFTGTSVGTSASTVGNMFGAPAGFGPFVGQFLSERIDVQLQALANDGKVKTLVQPSTMVSNKKQAKITIGQEVPYLTSSATTGAVASVSVAFKEIAMVLEATPTILGDGLMRLDVRFTIKEQIGTVAVEQNNTPVISNRESITNVFIRDGETLVIGGLMRERERDQENGIPFLKDIPLLGYLFKSRNIRKEKTDLLFFLTPTIVSSNRRGEPVKAGFGLEREVRPMVWDDDDVKKLGLLPVELAKPMITPKPSHYDTSKRPKTAKDISAE